MHQIITGSLCLQLHISEDETSSQTAAPTAPQQQEKKISTIPSHLQAHENIFFRLKLHLKEQSSLPKDKSDI